MQTESDSKRIIREWDREIDAELRRAAEEKAARGYWHVLSWTALWVVWLLFLLFLVWFFSHGHHPR